MDKCETATSICCYRFPFSSGDHGSMNRKRVSRVKREFSGRWQKDVVWRVEAGISIESWQGSLRRVKSIIRIGPYVYRQKILERRESSQRKFLQGHVQLLGNW